MILLKKKKSIQNSRSRPGLQERNLYLSVRVSEEETVRETEEVASDRVKANSKKTVLMIKMCISKGLHHHQNIQL
uniref:Putative ethanolamine utilization protein-like domain-containing protein n=1 Tax=Helianthus annuus TaxID=4232 RepID=A0A251RPU4_HELAN